MSDKTKQPKSLHTKVMNKVIYLMPIGIAFIGIIAYFVIEPKIYGKEISFIDWLFTDPQNIVYSLKAPNAVSPQTQNIMYVRIFWWVWLATFSTSLFFVGRQLQKKPELNATNAILLKKDAYFSIQEVLSGLKLVQQRRSGKELDKLIYNVKKLEERLSIESDFGYGSSVVIECENNIANQLKFLRSTLLYIETGNLNENISKMNTAVSNTIALLTRRRELKKK